MDKKRCLTHYTYGETQTVFGELLEFTCHPDDKEEVKKFLAEKVRTVHPALTHRVTVSHGGYGRYTRYNITQHKYAGGGCGYIEALEIKEPPDGRCGNVLHEYNADTGSRFYEFTTLENTCAAWEKFWGRREKDEEIQKAEGFIRKASCGILAPWFYAIGDQHLMGDFVFPEVISEDPEFRFGQKYVLRDWNGLPTVKTCMGVREFSRDTGWGKERQKFRTVYWDDGTSWDEYSSSNRPRRLMEEDLWIQEAMDKFRALLTGATDSFAIEFMDGGKFVGKYIPKKARSHHRAGLYAARLILKNGKKIEGRFDFEPTLELPTVEDNIRDQAAKKGTAIKSIKAIVRLRKDKQGYGGELVSVKNVHRWSGVYKSPEWK